jgi:ABC-type iron transport system FetAB permease component
MYPSQASPPNPASHLGWLHVCFGLIFVVFNSAISQILQLRIGTSLMIAALRCMVQLTVVAVILQHLLSVKKPWAVAGIACMSFLALEKFPAYAVTVHWLVI